MGIGFGSDADILALRSTHANHAGFAHGTACAADEGTDETAG